MRRIRRFLLGDNPRALLVLCAPTALVLLVDLALRSRLVAGFATQGKLIYLSSTLLSLAFWFLPLYAATRLLVVVRAEPAWTGRRIAAAVGLGAMTLLWFLPFATFCLPGQLLYRDVFGAYMGRNTLRLGLILRTTVRDWLASDGSGVVVGLVLAGVLVTVGLALVVRSAARSRPTTTPALSLVTFAITLTLVWYDQVDSRFLQAAVPDICFVHAVVHTARVALSGQWAGRQGISLRTPAPLPDLKSARDNPPNVLLILAESTRADAICSAPPPECTSAQLDAVAADRIPLGKLTTPAPNTFSSCVALWTGLPVTTDIASAHSAPVVWELAHAAGYRTAYITSQNPNYEDFGLFTRRAGIDVRVMATELGGMQEEQLGAPDERATAAALAFVREAPHPWFALLQLSNTHMPYRVDPSLQPNVPHESTPIGNAEGFHNQYKNSVLLEERTVVAFLRELRTLPGWDDTVILFMSDHGEQFREHQGLYHNHSLFDEEVRIPGFLLAGEGALDDGQRKALASFKGRRTYTQDITATLVDLFGMHDARARLPYGAAVVGRSLLRRRDKEPMMLLATSTAVWEPTDARFGVMSGERLLVGSPSATWDCYNIGTDTHENSPMPGERCPELLVVGRREFANVPFAK